MERILMIATGGTIASSKTKDGLVPTIDADQIISYIPEIKEICDLTSISIMSVDSTNMNPKRMAVIAQTIYDNYQRYDGFVVTHGTDTMGYTGAALTYMLQGIHKPVVLTGSQLSIEAPFTDAKQNLLNAVCFACEEVKGIFVAFDGKIISGTHAVKLKTKSMDSFQSINFPVIAKINAKQITYQPVSKEQRYWEKGQSESKLMLKTNVCEDIFVLKVFPGMKPDVFEFLKANYKGVIIESLGLGGIPNEEYNIALEVEKLIKAQVVVVITTQCLYEGIDLSVYAVGTTLAKQEIIYASDMTTEALSMKLMWALANCKDKKEVKDLMETPILADYRIES